MKLGSAWFLKAIITLVGIGVLVICIFLLPAGIMTDRVGYYRPILIGLYFPAIPFYVALYQALKLLKFVDKNEVFTTPAVIALKNIKICGALITTLFAAGMPYIYYAADRDDAPGVVAIGLIIMFASTVIAAAAALFQNLLANAVKIKSENDLTV